MSNIVSITSQGQISIPIKMRRLLGLDLVKKAYVTQESGKIIVEPILDFLELEGALSSSVIKNKSASEIQLLEQKAIKKARMGKHSSRNIDL